MRVLSVPLFPGRERSWPARFPLIILLAVLTATAVGSRDVSALPVGPDGVVLEQVEKGLAGEKAGLQRGDLLLAWSRGTEGGRFDSPFTLAEVEVEQEPRGPVRVEGRRGTAAQEWVLGPGLWGLTIRPVLPPELQRIYAEGREYFEARQFQKAAERWRAAAQVADSAVSWLPAWFLGEAAQAQGKAQRWPECDAAYAAALHQAGQLSPRVRIPLLQGWAMSFWERSDRPNAEKYYRQALVESQQQGRKGLRAAKILNILSGIAEPSQAEQYVREALAIRERLAPDSLEVAGSLENLGYVATQRGDLAQAEAYMRQALAIQEKRAPGSLYVARNLAGQGYLAEKRGDLAQAEACMRQALTIREKLVPNSIEFAASLSDLSGVAYYRGDFIQAESYGRQALSIWEKLAPNSYEVALGLNNLGKVFQNRGDWVQAEKYFQQSLAIWEKVAPNSLDIAAGLNNLGSNAQRRGDLVQAERYHRQALALREKLAPGSSDVAMSLYNLGKVTESRGDLAQAEGYYRQAVEIGRKRGADAVDYAHYLQLLGGVVEKRGDLARAEGYYRQALEINEKLAPSSALHAQSLHALGQLLRRQGQLAAATPLLKRALDAVESQTTRLGGTEEQRSQYRADYAVFYRDTMSLLLTQQEPTQAFQVLERSRARSMLTMLAERDLVFSADVAPELRQARERNAAQYDRVQAQLARLGPTKQVSQLDALQARLRDLARERDDLAEQLRRTSPRLAELEDPQPLDLAATRQALDPGTALLSYSVGPEQTILFVVQPIGADPGLQVFSIAIGEAVLRQRLQEFRQLVQQRSATSLGALQKQGQALYDLLLQPAEADLAAAQRLLIVPDGPLHTLAFAALRRGSQYLIEWKPLHTAVSATVYAELKKRRRPPPPPGTLQLAAFGAPHYPRGDGQMVALRGNPELRSAQERGFDFSPLPFSRDEVRNISALFPDRSETFLDVEATEERAKAIGNQVRYLHFATHGILDEGLPLNSAVVLTIPDRVEEGHDNGLLQAWEIFDQVRLDADLVVLSGCRTGLGQEVSGEGLVGLTRAFEYAGARSVLASLWSVDDRRTAQLMKNFYEHLAKGESKDRALQAAQLAMLRTQAPPFYWSAFALNGDWQ